MHSNKNKTLKRITAIFVSATFIVSMIIPQQNVHAQSVCNLPVPGTMVPLSVQFSPLMIKGVNIYPDNPFKFDFIIDEGDTNLNDNEFRNESTKLIKYFLASLTVPEDQMWVNLSPYEENRIIPEVFGLTEMGRDLLAQDYMLKQLTASLMYPDEGLGGEFWNRVYAKAREQFGTTEIPMNTFNKIWIVPEEATIYEHSKGVFIVESHLKVMLEEDYLALESNRGSTKHGLGDVGVNDIEVISGVSSMMIKEVLIPEIEKEVNQGKTFSILRQIYHSMLLATWYKKTLKDTVLSKAYVNQEKTKGIEVKDKSVNQKIYQQYVKAFRKGVFDFIKEDYDLETQEVIPRKYFSGGVDVRKRNYKKSPKDLAMTASSGVDGRVVTVEALSASGESVLAVRGRDDSALTRAPPTTGKFKSKGGFLIPDDRFTRSTDLEIYEVGQQEPNKKPYSTYYDRVFSDVNEFLDEQGISQDRARGIINSDEQSIVIGIPTFSDRENYDSQIEFFRSVMDQLKLLKAADSKYKDWPVRLVINVNGLNQERLLERILEFQEESSTPEISITVIYMPMGGIRPKDKSPGKKDAMNAIVGYARSAGATIVGFLDNDVNLSEGNIYSNIDFLVSKARELGTPMLTGSTPDAIPADTLWAKILSRQSRNRIRGSNRFAFLFSLPPLPSLPMSEDVYLRLYFADAEKDATDPYWRILANPNAQSSYSYAPQFRSFFNQEYRWELMDRWTFSLLDKAKQAIEGDHYGIPALIKYFQTIFNASKGQRLEKFRKTIVHFVLRDGVINHMAGFELWVRQIINRPRYSADLGNSNSRISKLLDTERYTASQESRAPDDVDGSSLVANPDDVDEAQLNDISEDGVEKSKTKGGIDLNPGIVDLTIEKEGNGINITVPPQELMNVNIEGLVPVIINVVPITNMQMLLGGSEIEQGEE